jgi:mannose-1-phosphate guanylyltransferase/phosphomannomutase
MPKPMVRILDVPVMEYAIRLLRRHGICQIAVTLRYLPDVILDYFGDGSRFGVSLTYFTETAALGTAGGVKQAQDFLNEPFVVLSGDGLTDCDLSAAIAFHQRSRAQATLITVRAEDPREYGLVCADADGIVRQSLEAKLIHSVGRVADQLAQEDLLIRIYGIDHQVKKLFAFCLKLFHCHLQILLW